MFIVRWRSAAIGVISVALVLMVWYAVTEVLQWVGRLELPSPVAVVERMTLLFGRPYLGQTMWGHIADSVRIVLLGWFVAGLIGAPSGVLMAWSRRYRSLTYPAFQVLRPISPIAWIPLAIAWLGIGVTARVFIVFVAAVVPWVVNSMESVRSVDPILVRAARNLGASSTGALIRVVIPAGLPMLVGGARVALGNAWMAVIAAELLAATSGLGYVALQASKALDTTTTVGAMVLIGVIGLTLAFVMRRSVVVLAPWSRTL